MQRKNPTLPLWIVVFSLVFALVFPSIVGTAQSNSASDEAKAGGTLNLSLGPDFVTFNPFYDETNKEFKPVVFEALLRRTSDLSFEPWLAKSWEISDDERTVTIHLREGVKFHNGREMTADDIVWSLEEAANPEPGYHVTDFFTDFAGAEKVDKYTVKANYQEPTHLKLDGLARLYIFPKEALPDIKTKPVGTGAFKFEEWVPDDHATFVKFEDYWRSGLPYLDKLVVKPMPDPQSAMLNIQAGTIDFLMRIPKNRVSLLEKTDGLTIDKSPPGFNFPAFIININRSPFDNKLVRQAMNYALNRDEMSKLAFGGVLKPAKLPIYEESWAYDEKAAEYYQYDPEKAKELLAEAGYPDGFKFDLTVRGTSGFHLDQAQVYAEQLSEIGVEANLVPTQLPQYWPKLIDSNFDMVSHRTGGASVDPQGVFASCAATRPFRNFFGITDNETWFPRYKEAAEKAGRVSSREKRKEYYTEALNIVVEQGWTIPTVWWQVIVARRDYVKGSELGLNGEIYLTNTWLDR